MSSASDKASCLRDGAMLSNLVHLTRFYAREGNEQAVSEAVGVMDDLLKSSDCIPGPLREKVNYELDVVKGSLKEHNERKIVESVENLANEVAPPITPALPRGRLPIETGKGFALGPRVASAYQLTVNGKPVGKPIGRSQAAADFEAALMLYPDAKVELVPYKAPPPERLRATSATTPALIKEEGAVTPAIRSGYIEYMKETKDGEEVTTGYKVYDQNGVLQQTVELSKPKSGD